MGRSFRKNMTLSEVIESDNRLLYVLPRFGIRLGFGDITVADICKKHNVSQDIFLLICNIYAFNDYIPQINGLDKTALKCIMSYLKQSHTDYLNKRIPHILEHIESIADEAHLTQKSIVKQFCENYRKDVIEHFDYEEKIVFPYIESLIEGDKNNKYKIDNFLHNHTNIDDKLHDLKSIVMKYIEPKDDDLNRDLLIDIYLLEEDLKRHTLIEEKILVALTETIE